MACSMRGLSAPSLPKIESSMAHGIAITHDIEVHAVSGTLPGPRTQPKATTVSAKIVRLPDATMPNDD